MKKTLALLLAIMMLLSFTACGAKPAAASSAAPASSTADVADDSVVDEGDEASEEEEDTTSDDTIVLDVTSAYVGVTEANEDVCMAFNDDLSLSILIVINENGEYVSFIGAGTDNGDGSMTISDETNGMELTFGVEEQADGSFILDMGDLGSAQVAEEDVSVVMEMMELVNTHGTAVA